MTRQTRSHSAGDNCASEASQSALSEHEGKQSPVPPTTPVPEAEGGGELIARLRAVPRGASEYGCQNCDEHLKAEAADAIVALMAVRDGQRATIRGAVAAKQAIRKALDLAQAYIANLPVPTYGATTALMQIERALSSEAPPSSSETRSGSDSAPATDAENPSQERAAVVPAAEQAGGAERADVWRVCHALRGECEHCPPIETTGLVLGCTRGCYASAEECANIVLTGNPWRKAAGVSAPWVILPPPDHDAVPSAEGGSGKDARDAIAKIVARAVNLALAGVRAPGRLSHKDAGYFADEILALLQSPRGEA